MLLSFIHSSNILIWGIMTAWGGTGSDWFAPPFEVLAAFDLPCGAPPETRFFGDIPGKAGGRRPPN